MAPLDTKQYLEEILKAAGVSPDDATKQALQTVFGNEAVSKRLSDDVLRQQDYSRNMDALKTDRSKWEKWYADSLAAYQQNEQTVAQAKALAQRYETEYGPLDGSGNGNRQPITVATPSDVMTKKDFEAALEKQGQATISLLKDGLRLATQHMYEFKEPLDTDALAKNAVEKGIPLTQAYNEMVQPKREETLKAQWEAKIAAARDEGAKDFASKHKIPVDSRPKETSPLHAILTQPKDPNAQPVTRFQREQELRNSFVDEWNKAPAATTSGG